MEQLIPFEITLSGWANCGRYWSWDRRKSQADSYDLWYVVSGKGRVEGANSGFNVQTGDVIIYPPNALFTATQNISNRLIVSFTHFNISHENILSEWVRQDQQHCYKGRVRDQPFMAGALRRCWQHYSHQEEQKSHFWLMAEMMELHEQFSGNQLYESRYLGELDQLCEAIRLSPGENWQTDEMAAELDVSPSYFNKLFRAKNKVSPRQFVINVRVQQSQSLLLFSELSIGEIAEKLGYPDQFSFSKQFKKQIGQSPSSWRDHAVLR